MGSQNHAGLAVAHGNRSSSRRSSWNSAMSYEEIETPMTGAQTPTPLLKNRDLLSRVPTQSEDVTEQAERTQTQRSTPHLGDALENLARTMSADNRLELQRTISHRRRGSHAREHPPLEGLAEEGGSPHKPLSQGVPAELRNFSSEVIFVLVCSSG